MYSRKGVPPAAAEYRRSFLDEGTWALHEIKSTGTWRQFKLTADREVIAKANYKLYWNGERLDTGKDSKLLEEHRPDLYDQVLQYLEKNEQPGVAKTPTPRTSIGIPPKEALLAPAGEAQATAATTQGVVSRRVDKVRTLEADGTDWDVWVYSPLTSEDQRKFKITGVTRIEGRTNYTVTWTGKRLIRDQQYIRLSERPELLTKLLAYFEYTYHPADFHFTKEELSEMEPVMLPPEGDTLLTEFRVRHPTDPEGVCTWRLYQRNKRGSWVILDLLSARPYPGRSQYLEIPWCDGLFGNTSTVSALGAQHPELMSYLTEFVYNAELTNSQALLQANDLSERIEHDLKEFC